jgi:catechol 2,3-dioxygenase-like lactoylglutathione lyase family enzyme
VYLEMSVVEGLHHVTFLTEDVDRLSAFYVRVFDARKTLDMTEEGVRHLFLEVGAATVLHPFQILEGPTLPPAPGTDVPARPPRPLRLLGSFTGGVGELRRRLEAEAAVDGDARDVKMMWIMGFHDPDGLYAEVVWHKPDTPDAETLPRAEWKTVELS